MDEVRYFAKGGKIKAKGIVSDNEGDDAVKPVNKRKAVSTSKTNSKSRKLSAGTQPVRGEFKDTGIDCTWVTAMRTGVDARSRLASVRRTSPLLPPN